MRAVIVFVVVSLAVVVFMGVTVGAQVELYPSGACGNTGTSDMCTKGGNSDARPLVAGIVSILLFIAGVISVLFMLLGGFKFITASGDASKLASAKNTIVYALIGLVVAVLAYGIAQIVMQRILGQ